MSWQERAERAMAKLELYWSNYRPVIATPEEEFEYQRRKALDLEALCAQKVDGADFYP